MTAKRIVQNRSRAETETWIHSLLEADAPLPLEELFAVLAHFASAGRDRRVDGWAALLQEALINRNDGLGMLQILAMRCAWNEHDHEFKSVCTGAVERAFPSRLGKVLFKNAGFADKGITAAEAVRRMELLARLQKGVLCVDKTWGFGTVQRVDDFYARVTIDFERKRGHEMAMAYAAESLDIVPESHLLVRLHRDKNTIRRLVKEDPAGLVRLAIESYGPLSVDALKGHLTGSVFEERDWKGFWDSARKALKSDPLVHLPPKRTDPIRLLQSVDSHVEEQFASLGAQREPESILKKVDELGTAGLLDSLTAEQRDLVADRLAFAVWGAEDRDPVFAARGLLTAERLGVIESDGLLGARKVDVRVVYGKILDGSDLQDVLQTLPVRLMASLVDRLLALFPARTAERLLSLLPTLSIPVLQEALPRLGDAGEHDRLVERVRDLLKQRKANAALLFWLMRNPDAASTMVGSDAAELLHQGLDALEWTAAGEILKAQHQLRGLYESGPWLCERLQELTGEQREVFLMKLQSSRGWDESGRRSVLAGIIKTYPELQAIISGRTDVAAVQKTRARMTSWRSYRERQEQFRRLMEVEIPENSKEIAVARSYGDLRENSEFKYAKEHQRILHRRRDEMEQGLDVVKGTDFAGCPVDVAGMGTEVDIRRPGGASERYCILGEWDRDEGLNIISSLSLIAQQLEGHHAGDRVELPGLSGSLDVCELVTVTGLGDAVRLWLSA